MPTIAQALSIKPDPARPISWAVGTVVSSSTSTATTTVTLDSGATTICSYPLGSVPLAGYRVWIALFPQRPHIMSIIAKPI